MPEKLDWVDNKRGKHVGVRVTYEDGTSEVYGIKAPGFFGRFGHCIKRLSIDRHNLRKQRDGGTGTKMIWRR